MAWKKKCLILLLFVSHSARALPYFYPQVRYEDAENFSLGGVSLPMTDSVVGNMMNNPAGLAKNELFQAEYLNLGLQGNSSTFAHFGTSTISEPSMKSYLTQLNADANSLYGMGGSLSSAISWKGFAFGVVTQQSFSAVSSNGTISYTSTAQTIPAIAFGIPLARGVVRLGYSLQYVNQTSGIASTSAANGPYGYTYGLLQGHGFSNNASANFVFPYTYLPTVSVIARNILGLNYSSGSLLGRADSPAGLPQNEPMVVDAALNFTVRVTGTMKTIWYFQYQDAFHAINTSVTEHFATGVDFQFSKAFSLRGGLTGGNNFFDPQFSLGMGYRNDGHIINFAWYHERNPLAGGPGYDTRYMLQYTLRFNDSPKVSRTKEKK